MGYKGLLDLARVRNPVSRLFTINRNCRRNVGNVLFRGVDKDGCEAWAEGGTESLFSFVEVRLKIEV
jgi:hypothetical protein